MSQAAVLEHSVGADAIRRRVYFRVALLITSTIIVCATLIIRYTDWAAGSFMAEFSGLVEVGINTLMPYMISAVVAAITAIAIISILPSVRNIDPAEKIVDRLRELNTGNLSSRVNLHVEGHLREIAYELNRAVGTLNQQVTTLKVVNRQQWQVLCEIRGSVQCGDTQTALKLVEEMEKNWSKIAEIEENLTT